MTTFGEISWEDNVPGDKSGGKDLFIRLTEGSNELRLVTRPYQYLVHKYKKEPNNPKDFGTKIPCSAIHGSCPLCTQGNSAKPRWLLGVIDRKTNGYKVLDVGYAVFQQIRKLAKNPKWGDPTKYDVDVLVDPHGGATGYYTVQPLSKEPLSAEDQVTRDNADLEDLKRRVTPPTPDVVVKRIEKLHNGNAMAVAGTQGKPQVQRAAAAPPPVEMSDDTDDEFPDYGS